MSPSDSEATKATQPARKPYAAPKIIYSELSTRVTASSKIATTKPLPADYHSHSTSATS